MKKFFYLAVLCLSFATVGHADTSVSQDSYVITNLNSTITVKFFPHNSPSIDEYTQGKARVNTILTKIASYDVSPRVETVSIGIAPVKMVGGDIVEENGNLYISITATDDAIEARLLSYFSISYTVGSITYFSHNAATIETLIAGRAMVERVIAHFTARGLVLVFPDKFEIGISPGAMIGGNIVEEGGKTYISITSTDEEVERYLMKFVRE